MFSLNTFVKWIKHSPNIQSFIFLAESLGKLAIIFAIVSYLIEYPDRIKQRYYQAWQVMNSAHLSSGDGGRKNAISDLVEIENDLPGLDLTNATIEKFDLRGIVIPYSRFNNASIKDSMFSCKPHLLASCDSTVMTRAFLGGDSIQTLVLITNNHFEKAKMDDSTLQNAILQDNIFDNAELARAFFSSLTFNSANSFKGAHLEQAHFSNVQFAVIGSGQNINIDFTDANLDGATYDGQPISADDLRSNVVRLCRTKFSNNIISNRDCSPKSVTPQ